MSKAHLLVNHRELAESMGQTPKLVSSWIRQGTLPPPHSTFGRTMLYRREHVEAYFKTGHWPKEAWKP